MQRVVVCLLATLLAPASAAAAQEVPKPGSASEVVVPQAGTQPQEFSMSESDTLAYEGKVPKGMTLEQFLAKPAGLDECLLVQIGEACALATNLVLEFASKYHCGVVAVFKCADQTRHAIFVHKFPVGEVAVAKFQMVPFHADYQQYTRLNMPFNVYQGKSAEETRKSRHVYHIVRLLAVNADPRVTFAAFRKFVIQNIGPFKILSTNCQDFTVRIQQHFLGAELCKFDKIQDKVLKEVGRLNKWCNLVPIAVGPKVSGPAHHRQSALAPKSASLSSHSAYGVASNPRLPQGSNPCLLPTQLALCAAEMCCPAAPAAAAAAPMCVDTPEILQRIEKRVNQQAPAVADATSAKPPDTTGSPPAGTPADSAAAKPPALTEPKPTGPTGSG